MISGHVFIATSLDGFIAKADGDIEWLISRDDPSEDHGYNAFIRDIDGIVMGRGSFEKAVTFDPWPYAVPVVVLSRTLSERDIPARLKGSVRVLDQTPRAAMAQLAGEGWRRAYVDGGQLIQSFLREGLIADLVISTVPVILGEGRSLFGPMGGDVALKHQKTTVFPSGLVQSLYSVTR